MCGVCMYKSVSRSASALSRQIPVCFHLPLAWVLTCLPKGPRVPVSALSPHVGPEGRHSGFRPLFLWTAALIKHSAGLMDRQSALLGLKYELCLIFSEHVQSSKSLFWNCKFCSWKIVGGQAFCASDHFQVKFRIELLWPLTLLLEHWQMFGFRYIRGFQGLWDVVSLSLIQWASFKGSFCFQKGVNRLRVSLWSAWLCLFWRAEHLSVHIQTLSFVFWLLFLFSPLSSVLFSSLSSSPSSLLYRPSSL